MKDKIFLIIIGILVGAVLATGAFYIYTITANNSCNCNTQMNGGTPPDMPNGQGGTPPAMPSGENNGQPPEQPGENNSQENN